MSNVMDVVIDEDIVLDEDRIKGMPDDLKGHLLVTMTIACKKYECHWKELTWKIEFCDNQPIIKVKRRT
jgi:hypothetical protein